VTSEPNGHEEHLKALSSWVIAALGPSGVSVARAERLTAKEAQDRAFKEAVASIT
jgi:hypothetical protein